MLAYLDPSRSLAGVLTRIERSRSAGHLRAVFATALLLAALVPSLTAPAKLNWDLVPYLGVANTFLGADSETAHQKVFDLLRGQFSEAEFNKRFRHSRYTIGVEESAEAFANQFPLYSVKPMYPALIALGMSAGFDPLQCAIWIAKIAVIGALMLFYLWMRSVLSALLAASVTLIVGLSPPIVSFA